jgi:hypothetical protein
LFLSGRDSRLLACNVRRPVCGVVVLESDPGSAARMNRVDRLGYRGGGGVVLEQEGGSSGVRTPRIFVGGSF